MDEEEEPQPGPSGERGSEQEITATSQDKVLEYSILDIPGISYDDEDEEDPTLRLLAESGLDKTGVSAVPSGSGMTFTLDSTFDNDDPSSMIPPGFGATSSTPRKGNKDDAEEDDEEEEEREEEGSDEEGSDQATHRKKRELTDKFMAGKMSFSDLLREIKENSDEGDSDESGDDEEWRPTTKKTKPATKPVVPSKDDSEFDEQDHQARFESELDQTRRQQLGKKRKKVGGAKTRRKRLDPALQGLMGEANLRFVRGDKNTAVRMCMEVIRQDPTAPEPFQTLSTLYEEDNEPEKSLQFALIAAHLAPQDAEEWARLADMSLEMQNLSQAAACYRKAIDADIENIQFHVSRCTIFERMGEKKAALRGYKRLLGVLKDDQGTEYMQASKEVARLFHERGDMEEAKDAIEEAMRKHPSKIGTEDVNLLLELQISLGLNDEALDILVRHCSVRFTSDLAADAVSELAPEQQLEAFTSAQMPPDSPTEVKTKLIVVLVNLNASHLVKDLCKELLEFDAESYGDLMLDVSESMMSSERFKESIPFLEKLVNSEEYGQAAVWLKYGESLFAVGRLDDAENAYTQVVTLAPQHHEARRTLSAILHKLGRAEEALDALAQDEEAELLNPTLLYERCQLLLSEGCIPDFVSKAKLLFSRHFVNIRNRDELHAIAGTKKLTSKNKALNEVRTFRKEQIADEAGPSFDRESDIALSDEFELFRKLCNVLYEEKRFGELQRVTFSALGSPYFNKKPEVVKECEFLCLLASFLNGDSYHAYNLVRELVFKHMKESRIWNLLNLVILRADDIRHNRFLMRLMSRNPDNIALGILNGHNCLVAGTYKYSLGEYMAAFKLDPQNPMVALMLGLTFTHLACQKFSAKKHSLVVQSCAFLNTYLQLRGPCQESYYNLGRAMHQLGLLPAALHYYKKALALKPAVIDRPIKKNEDDEEEFNQFDLSRETAFNVSLIYQSSGSMDLARMYLQDYVVV